jgi:hypothetical protein
MGAIRDVAVLSILPCGTGQVNGQQLGLEGPFHVGQLVGEQAVAPSVTVAAVNNAATTAAIFFTKPSLGWAAQPYWPGLVSVLVQSTLRLFA